MKFNKRWEERIYAQGLHLNRWPSEIVVSTVFSLFGGVLDRSKVSILDLGCGAGSNAAFMAKEGFSVVGIDGSDTALAAAKKRLDETGCSAELLHGDFHDSRIWSPDRYDLVVDRGSLTHNRRDFIDRTIDLIQGSLKPGGYLLSQIFSTEHGSLSFGKSLGDGSFDDFRDGYFTKIGLTFFADESGVRSLVADKLQVCSLTHVKEHEVVSDSVSAKWFLLARKA